MKPCDIRSSTAGQLRQTSHVPRAQHGDCSKFIDYVGVGHADASVTNAECALLVGYDTDVELLLRVED
jgi:hypothetical protein